MPRRQILGDEKRERLAAEQENLRRLMLQPQSVVRRSSLREAPAAETDFATGGERAIDDSEQTAPTFSNPHTEHVPAAAATEQTISQTESLTRPVAVEELRVPMQAAPVHIAVVPPDEPIDDVPIDDEPVTQERKKTKNEAPPIAESADAPTAHFEKYVSPKKKRSLVLPLLALLLAVIAGFWYVATRPAANAGQKPVAVAPAPRATDTALIAAPPGAKDSSKTVASRSSAAVPPPPASAMPQAGVRYTVISKAYFHDAPAEATRRKAFINHWNNAVLQPLDEKNGFVYIVFTNHLGQTSKGWLLKKDLRPLN